MSKRSVLCLVLILSACASPEERPASEAAGVPAEPAAGETCVVGTLTNEGVECPAMQTIGGDVYTLVGELAGSEAGDLVCACGHEVEQSTCMQGTTIEVTRIGSPALCP